MQVEKSLVRMISDRGMVNYGSLIGAIIRTFGDGRLTSQSTIILPLLGSSKPSGSPAFSLWLHAQWNVDTTGDHNRESRPLVDHSISLITSGGATRREVVSVAKMSVRTSSMYTVSPCIHITGEEYNEADTRESE